MKYQLTHTDRFTHTHEHHHLPLGHSVQTKGPVSRRLHMFVYTCIVHIRNAIRMRRKCIKMASFASTAPGLPEGLDGSNHVIHDWSYINKHKKAIIVFMNKGKI